MIIQEEIEDETDNEDEEIEEIISNKQFSREYVLNSCFIIQNPLGNKKFYLGIKNEASAIIGLDFWKQVQEQAKLTFPIRAICEICSVPNYISVKTLSAIQSLNMISYWTDNLLDLILQNKVQLTFSQN